MDYVLHIIVMVCIYATLAVALDLLAGQTGIVSVAHAAFYGLGAYTSALLAVRLGAPFPLGILGGILVATLASFLISLTSLRLHNDYFVMATFGFQMIILSILNNWMAVTQGPIGIANIPNPSLLGFTINSPVGYVALAIVLVGTAYLIVNAITSSPFGRVLRAIREDEVFTESLGKNTLKFKTIAFAMSAALAASAGGLYAHYVTFIDPTSFSVMESILVLSMVIIGGAGSRRGPLIGAAILVILPEVLRFIGLPSLVAANTRQIIYGSLLIVMMMFRPRGFVGRFGFRR